jgi:hypothetical protein
VPRNPVKQFIMRIRYKRVVILLAVFVLIPECLFAFTAGYTTGKVIDFYTKCPIDGAIVTINNKVSLTDEDGIFTIETLSHTVAVRAYGYMRTEQQVPIPILATPLINRPLLIELVPFRPKALYLSVFGIGDRTIRNSALELIEKTELNALVIDVKGDRGIVNYRSTIPLASEVGSQKIIIVKDIKGMIKSLKEKGIYTIARIVVFKDNPLALARTDLAVKTRTGAIWHDREGLAWVDPFKKEVWDYNIKIAIEAAQSGFDEIQFDYVRFPDTEGLQFSKPNTEENRVQAISGFLMEAKNRLISYNVFLATDIFGYVFWNTNDTYIGQKLEEIIPLVDYISPMLYPSGFSFGIPHYRNPVAHPYEIVYLTLKNGQKRTHLPSNRFRPWLQAFRDYAFDKRTYTGKEMRDQINAAENFGTTGWMLWNPRNMYSSDGLKKNNVEKSLSGIENQ